MEYSSRSPLPSLTTGQKRAMVNLLGDEDTTIYATVRQKLLTFSSTDNQWLEPYLLDNDPLLRTRVREILDHQKSQAADTEFLGFCLHHGEDFDLEEAIWKLAKTRYPSINTEGYEAILDDYAGQLLELIDFGDEAEQILAVINQFFFQNLNFTGNARNFYEEENSYLNKIIDRRTGNPIGLCLIYLFIARRLRLPIVGIGMPSHFICRFQTLTQEIYIDVFSSGKLWTKADCVRYLQQTGFGFQESFLAPATPRRVLLRICSNLCQIYSRAHQEEHSTRIQRYIVALAK